MDVYGVAEYWVSDRYCISSGWWLLANEVPVRCMMQGLFFFLDIRWFASVDDLPNNGDDIETAGFVNIIIFHPLLGRCFEIGLPYFSKWRNTPPSRKESRCFLSTRLQDAWGTTPADEDTTQGQAWKSHRFHRKVAPPEGPLLRKIKSLSCTQTFGVRYGKGKGPFFCATWETGTVQVTAVQTES